MLSLLIDDAVVGALSADECERLEIQLGRMVHAAWLSEKTQRELEVDLRLTDDTVIHELNRDYRDKDRPTDVLAFAQREGGGPQPCPEVLGDVVISLDMAARQAKDGLYGEVVFLAAHGLCHLLGYDHQDDEEEAAMNGRMARLLEESRGTGPVQAA